MKAAMLNNGRVIGGVTPEFPIRLDFKGLVSRLIRMKFSRGFIAPFLIWENALAGPMHRISVMSPAWVAMDQRGKAITPIVTHQDRRSVKEAVEIEEALGKTHHLSLAGVRPVPGGISSTTFAWFSKHHRSLMKRADLVGHLNTFLIRTWTGNRVVDPSNASFMGLFSTMNLLRDGMKYCARIFRCRSGCFRRFSRSDQVGGQLTRQAAGRLWGFLLEHQFWQG